MIISDQERHRRSVLRLAGVRDGKVYIGPATVCIPVTNRCSLSCGYCWYHCPGNPARLQPVRDMPLGRFQEIVNDCVDLGVDNFHLAGEGEPTLHPQFTEMMNFLEKQPLLVSLFTNGTFSEERRQDVVKADEVIINLSAGDSEGYRLLQGEDFFDNVIENIRQLVRFRDAGRSSLRISVDYVITKINLQQRHKAEAMLKELGVDFIESRIMSKCDYNRDLFPDIQGSSILGAGKQFQHCFNGWFYVITTLDGKVRFCFQRMEWEIVSVEKMSFREAWHSHEFMQARLDGRCGRLGKIFKECQNCLFYTQNDHVTEEFSRRGMKWPGSDDLSKLILRGRDL